MLKVRCIFVSFVFFFLLGCSHQFNEQYLIRHPLQLRAMVDQCNVMGDVLAQANPSCVFAKKVYYFAIESTHISMDNPQDLGKAVLTAQAQLVVLKQKINAVKTQLSSSNDPKKEQLLQQLNQQHEDLKLQINVMVTFVAIREGM